MKEERVKGTLLKGDLGAMDLAALVQLKGGEKARILLNRGDEEGVVYVGGRRMLHARVGSREGEEAFFYLLTWHDGEFVVEEGEPQEVTMGGDVSLLLLRGAQVLDEVMEGDGGKDYLPLVKELEQIPSVWEGGVYQGGEVEGLSFPQGQDLIQAIEGLDRGFSWGEIRLWRGGKLILVRQENEIFFFHVDLRYDPKKLFRVLERRLGDVVA